MWIENIEGLHDSIKLPAIAPDGPVTLTNQEEIAEVQTKQGALVSNKTTGQHGLNPSNNAKFNHNKRDEGGKKKRVGYVSTASLMNENDNASHR